MTTPDGSTPDGPMPGSGPLRATVYVGTSVDGFIADPDGGVSWLDPYFSPEVDFPGFAATLGATVMGRATFDQALELARGGRRPRATSS